MTPSPELGKRCRDMKAPRAQSVEGHWQPTHRRQRLAGRTSACERRCCGDDLGAYAANGRAPLRSSALRRQRGRDRVCAGRGRCDAAPRYADQARANLGWVDGIQQPRPRVLRTRPAEAPIPAGCRATLWLTSRPRTRLHRDRGADPPSGATLQPLDPHRRACRPWRCTAQP